MVDNVTGPRSPLGFTLVAGAFAGLVAGVVVAAVAPAISWWLTNQSSPSEDMLAALARSIAVLVPTFTFLGLCGGFGWHLLRRLWPGSQNVALGATLALWTLAMCAYFTVYAYGSRTDSRWGGRIGSRISVSHGLWALCLTGLSYVLVRTALVRYHRGQRRLFYLASAVIGVTLFIPALAWLLWSP